jgi:hypothetical protein
MKTKDKKPLDHSESVILNHMTLMAQQSLDPELYDMFCKVHDGLIDNRRLQNEKLN